jgi:hypothetical protein
MKDAADHSSIVCAIFAAHVRGKERRDAPPLIVAQPNKFRRIFSAPFGGREFSNRF